MNASPPPKAASGSAFHEAISVVQRAVAKYRGCSPAEKERLRLDLLQLEQMQEKLTQGRVEIVLFGEISTGKSALINALVGQHVAEVDVQGGWTKQAHGVPWVETDYVLPGLDGSQLILVDTPGINEVGDSDHDTIAKAAARRGDLILFVTDSDINEVEYSAMVALAAVHKPILVVLNKIDLYTEAETELLLRTLRDVRLVGLVPPENFVTVSADPRQVEYVYQDASGRETSQWKQPEPDVARLKARILEILARDGSALIALNAAMYAADKTDRIAKLRIELRDQRANQLIWSFAATKAIAVGVNAIPIADVLGGAAVDVAMVVALSRVYGLELSWVNAQRLVTSIVTAAGLVTLTEWATHLAFNVFKIATAGTGTVLTAVPQGAAAGFGSYIVGNAAKHYLENGASWGSESPKQIIRRILDQTDKQSVLEHLKAEIKKKIQYNIYGSEKG
jgi:small GTP-binding protein